MEGDRQLVANADDQTPELCTTAATENGNRNWVPEWLTETKLSSRLHLLCDTDTAIPLLSMSTESMGRVACRVPLFPQLINMGEKLGFNSLKARGYIFPTGNIMVLYRFPQFTRDCLCLQFPPAGETGSQFRHWRTAQGAFFCIALTVRLCNYITEASFQTRDRGTVTWQGFLGMPSSLRHCNPCSEGEKNEPPFLAPSQYRL